MESCFCIASAIEDVPVGENWSLDIFQRNVCVGIYYSGEQEIKKIAMNKLKNKRKAEMDKEEGEKESNVRTGIKM